MEKIFALDLKVARRESGLKQQDCAYLLGISPTKMSMMETGKLVPSVREVCTLSFIYGKSFESLFDSIFDEVKVELCDRLNSLPEGKDSELENFNRSHTLNDLFERLQSYNDEDYET
ncbi:MAG: helix-turn-helix domain-containing protein [Rhizobiales bacterium]|nr:helix-turn-helix domain-containing protein [Hyphomicrobiales bacterium]NRB15096.1 helix-turn-helix domain-containing protein [Hyphomicrobiales bacterium]